MLDTEEQKSEQIAALEPMHQVHVEEPNRDIKSVELNISKTENIIQKSIENLDLPNDKENKGVDGPVEDLPRASLQLCPITEFHELSESQVDSMEELLPQLIGTMGYNNLVHTDKLFKKYEALKKMTESPISLLDVFKELDFLGIDTDAEKEGRNCSGMSQVLQQKLHEEGIPSHLVRFNAGGLVNKAANKYVHSGHSALVVPRIINGKKCMSLLDPGILLSRPITFPIDGASAQQQIGDNLYQVITNPQPDSFSHTLIIKKPKRDKVTFQQLLDENGSPVWKTITLPFNAEEEWLNPDETLLVDVMRGRGDCKITKQTPEGKNLALLRVDIAAEKITIKLTDKTFCKPGESITDGVSFAEFLRIDTNPQLLEAFHMLCDYLGEERQKLKEMVFRSIRHSQEYKETIWAPSVREAQSS